MSSKLIGKILQCILLVNTLPLTAVSSVQDCWALIFMTTFWKSNTVQNIWSYSRNQTVYAIRSSFIHICLIYYPNNRRNNICKQFDGYIVLCKLGRCRLQRMATSVLYWPVPVLPQYNSHGFRPFSGPPSSLNTNSCPASSCAASIEFSKYSDIWICLWIFLANNIHIHIPWQIFKFVRDLNLE